MFNLEQAIIESRQQLARGGFNSREALDELESHLRDDVGQQIQAGMSAQQAFDSATQRIGQADALRSEYGKVKIVQRLNRRRFWSAALAMGRFRPAILVVNFLAALLTSPEVVSQIIVFAMLQSLYEGGLLIARWKERKSEQFA
ncbi:permease prefix domain 1-containing protein [Pedosphaera parvula]|uniref:Uncharacterized protein n=1 Tax=Pedosphaera parvula (strain Ellin514) TaxID=320771 RepID=B9XCL4_PEDPL|nr:permease prefix domain 1-containing protein [Pedosphaera parvula]EEF62682.1 hypothetical protein Cflav_PD5317 [Pedosphaera parvula Ellin514]